MYLFSLVGLVLIIIGLVQLIDLGLKAWVFTKADEAVLYPVYPKARPVFDGAETEALTPAEEEKYRQEQLQFEKENKVRERHRTAANSLAFIIVGLPLFLYHWRTIQQDKNNRHANVG